MACMRSGDWWNPSGIAACIGAGCSAAASALGMLFAAPFFCSLLALALVGQAPAKDVEASAESDAACGCAFGYELGIGTAGATSRTSA